MEEVQVGERRFRMMIPALAILPEVYMRNLLREHLLAASLLWPTWRHDPRHSLDLLVPDWQCAQARCVFLSGLLHLLSSILACEYLVSLATGSRLREHYHNRDIVSHTRRELVHPQGNDSSSAIAS